MADLSQDAWRSQFEADSNAVLLDVRTQDEVDEGMNASNLGAGQILYFSLKTTESALSR